MTHTVHRSDPQHIIDRSWGKVATSVRVTRMTDTSQKKKTGDNMGITAVVAVAEVERQEVAAKDMHLSLMSKRQDNEDCHLKDKASDSRSVLSKWVNWNSHPGSKLTHCPRGPN